MSTLDYRDGRFWKDGRPFFVIGADYPYYRDHRTSWRDRLTKLRDANVNTITFYIPWRHHFRIENGKRFYDFHGRTKDSRDVVRFMETVASLGLYFIAKPGPFVHSELNVGGLPDLVSPTFNPEIPPARRHHGGPLVWCYDSSQLPAPFDETFDSLVKTWLREVHDILTPYVASDGPLIAVQLNDETIYCTSNDPPWHFGYEPSGMRFFHTLLAQRYGDIDTYNRLHSTQYPAFEFVPGPQLPQPELPSVQSKHSQRHPDWRRYVDWAEYQWRLRRDLYARYKDVLDLDVPYLTNYTGVTPPIEENIPDAAPDTQETIPADHARLYADWWFAMNRIDTDADVYKYGFISWLGVAAYDCDVFDRYVNTTRRARGINMEENWGFAMLYDARSRCPIVPFFQTLVSVAGGASGYVIYCGAGTDYWDDDLDVVTRKQCPTFPSDAPIDVQGRPGPLYATACMLNRWFAEHGADLLCAEIECDVGYLLYAPYAAVSSWIPDERYWNDGFGHAIPRCGYDGFEPFSRSLQNSGYSVALFELETARPERMNACRALAIHTAFFMEESAQQKLVDYLARGGQLFISGELPQEDLFGRPCTLLKDTVERAIAARSGRVVYRRENLFAGGGFARVLDEAGIRPRVACSDNVRAYVHGTRDDCFVFFFGFDEGGPHEKRIQFLDQVLDLTIGSKTSGVVRVRGGRLVAHLVKGRNEVDGTEADIRIRFGEQIITGRGDFSSCDTDNHEARSAS